VSAFRRWRGRHEDAGLEGLYDRQIGRASAQRVAVDRSRPTQVGRALAQLGIEHIAAYSPAARGRSERMFATLQDRLPKELALTGIETVEAANRFIAEHYLPRHNARFAVTPAEPGSARHPMHPARAPGRQRQHRALNGLSLQIPPSPIRPHYVRATVRVHDYPDGTLTVFHGLCRLARYDADGSLLEQTGQRAA